MMANKEGPPEKERPGGLPSRQGQTEKLETNTNRHQINAPVRQCGADTVGVQLRRRRKASWRMVPLGETGNVRDPWQPWRPERLSPKQLEGAVAAAPHLSGLGLTPLFDATTLRAMNEWGLAG